MGDTMNKILNRLAYVVLISALLFLFYIGYCLFFPVKVLKLGADHYKLTKTTFAQGEMLTFYCDYEKFIPSSATVIRYFVDDIVYQLPVTQTSNPIGKHKFINRSIRVPDSLPPGEYKLRAIVTYRLNPFREEEFRMETGIFKVVSNEHPS
jgi:hypothetical protein